MKFLPDTHTLLWLVNGSSNLSAIAIAALTDPTSRLFVSVASIWELAIKTTKPNQPLILDDPLDLYLGKWLPTYQLAVLPIQQSHVLDLLTLPHHHRDPFDRIIIDQARCEGMSLISADGNFSAYPVTIVR